MSRILVILVLAFWSAAGRADECDVLAAKAVQRLGVAVHERKGGSVYLQHPLASGIVMDCTNSQLLIYRSAGRNNSEYPPPQFFGLLGALGEIMGLGDAAILEGAGLKCQEEMLRAGKKNYTIPIGRLFFCDRNEVDGLPKFGILVR